MKPSTNDYDDDRELTQYIGWNRLHFLTPFERRAWHLGLIREKAQHALNESPDDPPDWVLRILAEYDGQIDEPILEAIGDDLNGLLRFRDRVVRRIELAFKRGELRPNRCPECSRIVKTPKAKQCLWCGYDWHEE